MSMVDKSTTLDASSRLHCSDAALRNRELGHVVVVLLLLMSVWTSFRLVTGIQLEDALITFRHAANLAHGHGLVFNPGEYVLGTTTPLLACWLGLCGWLVGVDSIPLCAVVSMILAGALAAGGLYGLLREVGVGHFNALLVICGVGLQRDVVWSTVGGMETPLVLALMTTSLFLAVRQKYKSSSFACALLVLTRPDGLIWCVLVAAYVAVCSRRHAMIFMIVFLSIAGIAGVAAGLLYGLPLPHSMVAKSIVAAPSYDLTSAPALLGHARWLLKSVGISGKLGVGLWCVSICIGAYTCLRRDWRGLWPLILFLPALAMGYYVGRAPKFQWYLVPFTYCSMVVGCLGAIRIVGVMFCGPPRLGRSRWPVSLAGLFYCVILVVSYANGVKATVAYHRAHQLNEDGLRREVGEWLEVNSPPSATVAMEAIGYQGFYSRRRIVDLAGLVSPEVVAIHKRGGSNADAFEAILKELRPDLIVLRSYEVECNKSFHGGALFESDAQRIYFDRNYTSVQRLSAPDPDLWGKLGHLTIFRRVL